MNNLLKQLLMLILLLASFSVFSEDGLEDQVDELGGDPIEEAELAISTEGLNENLDEFIESKGKLNWCPYKDNTAFEIKGGYSTAISLAIGAIRSPGCHDVSNDLSRALNGIGNIISNETSELKDPYLTEDYTNQTLVDIQQAVNSANQKQCKASPEQLFNAIGGLAYGLSVATGGISFAVGATFDLLISSIELGKTIRTNKIESAFFGGNPQNLKDKLNELMLCQNWYLYDKLQCSENIGSGILGESLQEAEEAPSFEEDLTNALRNNQNYNGQLEYHHILDKSTKLSKKMLLKKAKQSLEKMVDRFDAWADPKSTRIDFLPLDKDVEYQIHLHSLIRYCYNGYPIIHSNKQKKRKQGRKGRSYENIDYSKEYDEICGPLRDCVAKLDPDSTFLPGPSLYPLDKNKKDFRWSQKNLCAGMGQSWMTESEANEKDFHFRIKGALAISNFNGKSCTAPNIKFLRTLDAKPAEALSE